MAALHAGLIGWAIAERRPVDPAIAPATVLALLAFPAPPAPMAAPPPEASDAVVDVEAPVVEIAPDPVAPPATTDCAPARQIATALAGDDALRAAIGDVAPGVRSDAGAIMLWNGDWTAVAGSADAPLARARAVIGGVLGALSPDCLAEPVIGPRLIAVRWAGGTALLAFGSGRWNWAQLGG